MEGSRHCKGFFVDDMFSGFSHCFAFWDFRGFVGFTAVASFFFSLIFLFCFHSFSSLVCSFLSCF